MLSIILGYAEIAWTRWTPTSLHGDLKEIASAATCSAEITRQVLAFARREAVNPQVLDLNCSVDGTLKMLRRLIGEDIALVWQPRQQVWPVRMDPYSLTRSWPTPASTPATPSPARRITIATEAVDLDRPYAAIRSDCPPGRFVLLSVMDNGSGMDDATRDRLFEPFYTTKGQAWAPAWGCPRCSPSSARTAAASTWRPRPEQAPRYASSCRATRARVNPVAGPTPAGPLPGGRETVLVVDDEPSILRLAGRMLGELGYRVLAASTPRQAVALARHHADPIHVLLTDVVMPEMNGYDLIDRMRGLYPDIGLVYMSGYAPTCSTT